MSAAGRVAQVETDPLNACSFGRVTYASASDAGMVRDTLAVDPEVTLVVFKHCTTGYPAFAAHS